MAHIGCARRIAKSNSPCAECDWCIYVTSEWIKHLAYNTTQIESTVIKLTQQYLSTEQSALQKLFQIFLVRQPTQESKLSDQIKSISDALVKQPATITKQVLEMLL